MFSILCLVPALAVSINLRTVTLLLFILLFGYYTHLLVVFLFFLFHRIVYSHVIS